MPRFVELFAPCSVVRSSNNRPIQRVMRFNRHGFSMKERLDFERGVFTGRMQVATTVQYDTLLL